MTDGHVEWPDIIARSDHNSEPPPTEPEGNPRATVATGLGVFSHQARLGAPNARRAQEQPQVSREAEAARVGDPLPVKEPEIRSNPKPPGGPEEDGSLSE